MRKKILYICGSITLSLICSFIYDGIKDLPILSTFIDISKFVWFNIFMLPIKLWIILLIGLFFFVLKRRTHQIIKTNKNSPFFKGYTKENIDTIEWTWKWDYDHQRQSNHVSDLKPICNVCSTKMYENPHFQMTWNCPRCKCSIKSTNSLQEIELIILDNVEKQNIEKQNG